MKAKHFILIGIFVIIIIACLPKNTTTPRSANVPNTGNTGAGGGSGGTGGNGTGSDTPIITITGNTTAFTTIIGTTSANKTYTVSGAYLKANIVLNAPNGFDISTNANSGFGNSLTLTQSGGNVSATTIYVRLTGAAVGAVSGNITHSSTDAITQNLSLSGTVNPVEVVETETNFFRFYPKTNGSPYPQSNPVDVQKVDGYIAIQFASWSIVSLIESQQAANLQSWIDFKMFDSDNNLVCHIKNTQANYHPNFAQFFPVGTDLRHNNHAYQYRKYIPFGTYRIEHTNISPQPIEQNLRLGTQGEGGNVYSKINQKVGVGTHTFMVEINEVTNQFYEYDCNPYSN